MIIKTKHKHKKLYGIILIILVMFSLAIYDTYKYYQEKTLHLNIVLGNKKQNNTNNGVTVCLKLTSGYDIKVYRNGKLVAERHKTNDPISINWYKMIANMMFGFIRTTNPLYWKDISGTSHSWVDTEEDYVGNSGFGIGSYNPVAYIVLGNGTGTPTLYDYKMFNEITKDVPLMNIVNDTINQRLIISYTKTFTIKKPFTLREVGLELRMDTDPSYGRTLSYLLLAHDIVQQPIQLYYGDSVSVTYYISIPYNTTGVLTQWFYNALIDYWLGYAGTTGYPSGIVRGKFLTLKTEGGTTGVIDTADDTIVSTTATNVYTIYDKVDGEYTYIEVGNGTRTQSWNVNSLSSLVKRKPITDTQCIAIVNETNVFNITYIMSFSFTQQISITEIGFSYYTDTKPAYSDKIDTGGTGVGSYSPNPGYYLWMYWKLPSPINIQANSGLRIEITIIIPYS